MIYPDSNNSSQVIVVIYSPSSMMTFPFQNCISSPNDLFSIHLASHSNVSSQFQLVDNTFPFVGNKAHTLDILIWKSIFLCGNCCHFRMQRVRYGGKMKAVDMNRLVLCEISLPSTISHVNFDGCSFTTANAASHLDTNDELKST